MVLVEETDRVSGSSLDIHATSCLQALRETPNFRTLYNAAWALHLIALKKGLLQTEYPVVLQRC